MRVDELEFELPSELIGIHPAEPRDSARLLVLGADGCADHVVRDLPSLVTPALFVLNDTRVLAARVFGAKATGGRVELLLVEPAPAMNDARDARDAHGEGGPERVTERWLALSKSSKPLAPGSIITLEEGVEARVIARRDEGFVELEFATDVQSWLGRVGTMPLPPYIDRAPDAADRERYQTVYANEAGAVAAPTAGLHFTASLLERIVAAGHAIAFVTLHVGPGTFRPVKVDDLDDHAMHEERYAIPEATAQAIREARSAGRPVIAVGTTVVRALESACDPSGELRVGEGRTRILLQPGSKFTVVDGLFTNFHLPRSTLLALVMAFAGIERTRRAYEAAVGRRYRFYSYGDAMFIPPGAREPATNPGARS